MTANDLQPKPTKITIKDKEYLVQPIRMSHRLIIARVQPYFKEIVNVYEGERVSLSSQEILELEKDFDVLVNDLIPGLKNVTLDVAEMIYIVNFLLEGTKPEDIKEAEDSNVKVGKEDESLKVEKT